ncbi:hypothetical protein U1Q18_020490, partial [Sarracenia purpurea var. burkii]
PVSTYFLRHCRHSSERTNQEEAQDAEEYDDWDDEFDSLSDDDDQYWPDEVLLFEMEIPRSNRLIIPAQAAAAYFPPLAVPLGGEAPKKVETLQLTDSESLEWYMPVTYFRDERAFMILRGWQEYADLYNLKPFDLIRFYRPVPRLNTHHFLIEHQKKEQESDADGPEFRPENFLFRLELDSSDIGYRRIFIPKEEVTNHFPEIKVTRRNKMTMRFTDAQNKDWYMDIILYNPYSYMIIDGWSGFVKEHNLEAMDVIKFYKPVQPLHMKHFLIEYVKREGEKVGDCGQPSGGGGSSVGGDGSGNSGGKGKVIDAGIQI